MTPQTDNQAEKPPQKCPKCGKNVFTPPAGGAPVPRLSMDEECCCEPEGIHLHDELMDGFDMDVGVTKQMSADPAEQARQEKEIAKTKAQEPAKFGREMAARLRKLRVTHAETTFSEPPKGQEKKGIIGLRDGAVIGGVYRINHRLGSGAMGDVYLAEHIMLGTKCALKVIPPEGVNEMSWKRFQGEAKVIARLDHVNLVKVSDLGVHEGCLPFYAMQYLEGQTLEELLSTQKTLPLAIVLQIFIPLCDGLAYAHEHGVVHRDLKPANIMLLSGPISRDSVKVLDFGLAKLTMQDKSSKSLTSAGEIFGSPPYMSPEQCRGDDLDGRSDVYSLGCTLFECLTGRTPFVTGMASTMLYNHQKTAPPTLASVVGADRFPASIEEVLACMLCKEKENRYQNMHEVRRDLERIAGIEPSQDSTGVLGRSGNFTGQKERRVAATRLYNQVESGTDFQAASGTNMQAVSGTNVQAVSGVNRQAANSTNKASASGTNMQALSGASNQAISGANRQVTDQSKSGTSNATNQSRVSNTRLQPAARQDALPAQAQEDDEIDDEDEGAFDPDTGAPLNSRMTGRQKRAYSDQADADVWVIKKPPRLVLALVSLLLAGLVGAYWFYGQHQEAKLTVAPVVSLDSKPLSEKEAGPFSTIVEEGGKRIRQFNFPLDVALGQIRSGSSLVVAPAIGKLQFPESDQIYFIPDNLLVKCPAYLSRFRPGDVYALLIPDVSYCNNLLSVCGMLPQIEKLSIYRCQYLNANGLSFIKTYPQLRELDCSYNHIDVSSLATLPQLKSLSALKLSGEENVGPVIKKLDGCQTTKDLAFDDCTLDFDSLEALTTLPNLDKLSLDSDNLTDGDLTTLSKCPSLRYLSIVKTPITSQTAEILKSFPNLKALHVGLSANIPAQSTALANLRSALPGVKVY